MEKKKPYEVVLALIMGMVKAFNETFDEKSEYCAKNKEYVKIVKVEIEGGIIDNDKTENNKYDYSIN